MSNRQYFSLILEEARLWQQQQGSEGWNYPFNDEWLLPRIRRNELWLVFDGYQPVAAFRVLMEDMPFWGERENGKMGKAFTCTRLPYRERLQVKV
ncbi:hypothetical protein [Mangrovibacter phragmitis]|uniref:hypothetical protein n=1 Tax=Mangrovibacter phragmitis TaxID=1691903 RepID=UPI00336A4766